MRRFFMQFAAAFLAGALLLTPAGAAGREEPELVQVGLAYGGGALASANLENNTGYGSGYRLGYFDENLDFVELARTEADRTQITMVKAQNLWLSGGSYSSSDNGGEALGCWHVVLEDGLDSYEEAAEAADCPEGFAAWIDGEYQARAGAYSSREEAQEAARRLGGTVAGTSAYAVNVTPTGEAEILFQFDGGEDLALGVMPDVTGEDQVRTWFRGYRYYGGFRYERIDGGGLTVVNIVDLETYIKGVLPYEMSNDWPLEALKAQAVCARSYAYINIHSGRHASSHFDVCSTTDCQVYHGAGASSASYQANSRTDRAVEETAGEYAWYGGNVIETFYASSHGGASESVYNVWGSSLEQYPYLCGVSDPYEGDLDSQNPYASWRVSYTENELDRRLKEQGAGVSGGIDSLILAYSPLGNVIQVQVNGGDGGSQVIKPARMRAVLGVSSIRFTVNGRGAEAAGGSGGWAVNGGASLPERERYAVVSGSGVQTQAALDSLCVISGTGSIVPASSGGTASGSQVTVSGSSYTFQGSGYGHQLGMSQYGAWAMAERGFSYDEIIAFYFPGAYVE